MVDDRPHSELSPEEQSLEQIEGDSWGPAPSDASKLVATVHELRRRPIGKLSPEDLRVLIGQGVGVPVLLPDVLRRLEREPLLEGDFYPGDVLAAVLRVPPSYWSANPGQLAALERALAGIPDPDPELGKDIETFWTGLRSA
jgi:CDI immunity proteins